MLHSSQALAYSFMKNSSSTYLSYSYSWASQSSVSTAWSWLQDESPSTATNRTPKPMQSTATCIDSSWWTSGDTSAPLACTRHPLKEGTTRTPSRCTWVETNKTTPPTRTGFRDYASEQLARVEGCQVVEALAAALWWPLQLRRIRAQPIRDPLSDSICWTKP